MSSLEQSPSRGTTINQKLTHLLHRSNYSHLSLLRWLLITILALFVILPLLQLLTSTITDDGLQVWQDVLFGRISSNLLWIPLRNTLIIGALVGLSAVVIGGFLAWLVVMTDVPGRAFIGTMAAIPFIIPSFAIALAWETIFRNDRISAARVGLLQGLGFDVPDWLAWGFLPVTIVLVIHYFSFGFMLISAALATVNAELIEAGTMVGASRGRILRDITLRVVSPALASSALLAFAEGASNFATPAILGTPVRFETLSTSIYGMVRIGQTERGYVLTVILILVAALLLWANNKAIGGRQSYATLTGKAGRRKRQALGVWRWPLFLLALGLGVATTILPLLALLGSSLTRRTSSLSGGLTSHFWIGVSDPSIAQGQAGILRNSLVIEAAVNTILISIAVAFLASAVGLLIGYVTTRGRQNKLNDLIGALSYVPFFIPGIAFGAIYIAQFGRPIGPFPALYGTIFLLIIAAAAYNLPFTSQSGRATMTQIANELEEAAIMTGAGFWRRLFGIIIPLAARGIIAGGVLVFVKMVRDLSLVVLLVTPTTTVLTVVAFQYSAEGFVQFANAIAVIIAGISITVTLLAQRLQGVSQPWAESR